MSYLLLFVSFAAITENQIRITAGLERSVILDVTGGINRFNGIPTSPSASEVVEKI